MLLPAPPSPSLSPLPAVGGRWGGTSTSVISTCCSTGWVGGAFWITSTMGVRPPLPPPPTQLSKRGLLWGSVPPSGGRGGSPLSSRRGAEPEEGAGPEEEEEAFWMTPPLREVMIGGWVGGAWAAGGGTSSSLRVFLGRPRFLLSGDAPPTDEAPLAATAASRGRLALCSTEVGVACGGGGACAGGGAW